MESSNGMTYNNDKDEVIRILVGRYRQLFFAVIVLLILLLLVTLGKCN